MFMFMFSGSVVPSQTSDVFTLQGAPFHALISNKLTMKISFSAAKIQLFSAITKICSQLTNDTTDTSYSYRAHTYVDTTASSTIAADSR